MIFVVCEVFINFLTSNLYCQMKHFSLANLDTVLKPFNLSYLTSSLKTMKNVSENLSDEIYLECWCTNYETK